MVAFAKTLVGEATGCDCCALQPPWVTVGNAGGAGALATGGCPTETEKAALDISLINCKLRI